MTREPADLQGLQRDGARRIRTADLLGAIRGGGQSHFVQEIADLQGFTHMSVSPPSRDSRAKYARICGDVI